jgi:hypothetical protein
MVTGNGMAQNDNKSFDSIRITMTTPYDAGVKWNCCCVVHDNMVSVSILESYRKIEIPRKNIVMPAKVIHHFFDLSDEQNTLFEGYKPLYIALPELAFDILEHRETIRKKDKEETESDTVWTVSIFNEGKRIDFFEIGNASCNGKSRQLTQLSSIFERIVYVGRFYTSQQLSSVCPDRANKDYYDAV